MTDRNLWEATKDGASKVWEKTKEWSSDAWEATKDGGEYVADKTSDAWEATKKAVSSKDDEEIEIRKHAENTHRDDTRKFD